MLRQLWHVPLDIVLDWTTAMDFIYPMGGQLRIWRPEAPPPEYKTWSTRPRAMRLFLVSHDPHLKLEGTVQ